MTIDIANLNTRIAIIGCGNIGGALAKGLVRSGLATPDQLTLTRRQAGQLANFSDQGYNTSTDNRSAIQGAEIIILAVQPQQVMEVLEVAAGDLKPGKTIISVVSGVTIADLAARLGDDLPVIRAMPNIAIEIGESITCLAARAQDRSALELATVLFAGMGITLEIDEELMVPATALGGCGVAFFLRCIRAMSQGGIEIGFHPEEALQIAAQAARGAAALILQVENHPEAAIDRVATPRGATISGLNTMEHEGLSSAIIKGIVASSAKLENLT